MILRKLKFVSSPREGRFSEENTTISLDKVRMQVVSTPDNGKVYVEKFFEFSREESGGSA